MKRMLALAILALVLLPISTVAQAPEYETSRIADGVYQFRWRAHNGFFVITDDGIVAIDPISAEAASQYAAEIKQVAPGKPLLAIVYSHDHADHATGANVLRSAFDSDASVIAHTNAAPKIAAAGSPELPVPDLTFSDKLTLHFGGRPLELHYLGKSHSDNMVIAYLPEDKVAFAVDFVSNDRVGYRELPDYHFPEFFETLGRLLELEFETIVFGHGPSGDRAAVERQVSYYNDLRNAVAGAVEEGWTEDEAAERVKLPAYESWGQYDEWFPMNVRAIYRWLKSEL